MRALTFEDYLPLRTLYARFDAIAEGRSPGHSPSAHQAVLDRLAANQRVAEGFGWTECTLERVGGRGRLIARGVRASGGSREVIPDWVPARLRATEHGPVPGAEAPIVPPVVAAASRARHDELRAAKRGWFLPASPPLTDGMFDRVAKPALGAGAVGLAVECAAKGRWLDDGGR